MNTESNTLNLYKKQFYYTDLLKGQVLHTIKFYLEKDDHNFSEQPNIYGKSLLNGFDMQIGNIWFTIGNSFSDRNYGLEINEGKANQFGSISNTYQAIDYPILAKNEIIQSIDLFWMKNPFDSTLFYPQEILLQTDNSYLLISSTEITNGAIGTEFTDELLIIETKKLAQKASLGEFSIPKNSRLQFKNYSKMLEFLRQKHNIY